MTSFADSLFEKRAKGAISDFDGAILIQKRAAELGLSLAKYLATSEGHIANQNLVRARYYEQQLEHSNGDLAKAARKKPINAMASTKETAVADSTRDGTSPDDDDDDVEFSHRVKRLMDKGLSHDQALSRIHRAEKRRRGVV